MRIVHFFEELNLEERKGPLQLAWEHEKKKATEFEGWFGLANR